jgi:hypothetical protein
METVSNVSSEEELLQLRDEGKISEDEYQELLAAMKKPSAREQKTSGWANSGSAGLIGLPGSKNVPGILWVALISLGLMILGKLLFAFKAGPVILVDAGISAVLLVGLYLRHKWAYVLTIVLVALGTIVAFSKGTEQGLGVAVLDCLVLVPVLMCTDSFFGESPADSGG